MYIVLSVMSLVNKMHIVLQHIVLYAISRSQIQYSPQGPVFIFTLQEIVPRLNVQFFIY